MSIGNDHISNLIARLLDKKRFFESKAAEAEDAINGLRLTQALLNDTSTEETFKPINTYKRRNKIGTIASKVYEWVNKEPPGAELKIIEIQKEIPEANNGTIRSALNRMAAAGEITFTRGAGFHKKAATDPHSVLVYDSTLPQGGQPKND